jgi:hypothetical protein
MQTNSNDVRAALPRLSSRLERFQNRFVQSKTTPGLGQAVRLETTRLSHQAPILGNLAVTVGIGITSAAISASVAPATFPFAMTVLAVSGGTLACCATLKDGDGLCQAVRTFLGGASASLWGPAAAAEGLAAGLLFGGFSALMLAKD